MTIDDAMGVLRGGDTAATDFLRKKTEPSLRKAFRPYFDKELQIVRRAARLSMP